MTKKKKKSAGTKKTAKKVKAEKKSRKPEFENALDEVVAEKQTIDDGNSVGKRPGPAPPTGPGAPDNLGRLDRELSKAPQALAPVLKIPFSIWASVSEIPEMKLSEDEALEWAEPIIALLEYYFPGKIPEIAWMWLMFLSATEKVIDTRVKIRYEKRQERTHPVSAPGRESAVTAQPAPKHNGAEPAQDYPQDG